MEMKFKGNKVFVEVDEAGGIVLEDGRARMKYSLDAERIYSPNPNNLTDIGAPEIVNPAPSHSSADSEKVATKVRTSARGAIVAYTDGACIGNPGPAGLGYVVIFPDGSRVQQGEPIGQGTNNIAELTAILRVLEVVGDPSNKVVIHTDSEYSIGVLKRGWKAKANRELISRIKQTLDLYTKVELRKVKGHAGIPENELVDDLARTAAETQKTCDRLI